MSKKLFIETDKGIEELTPQQGEWEKDFDDKFSFHPHGIMKNGKYVPNPEYFPLTIDNVKFFIFTLLQQQREELIGKIEGLRKPTLDKSDPDNYEAIYAITGFNDALSQVLNLIKTPRPEVNN